MKVVQFILVGMISLLFIGCAGKHIHTTEGTVVVKEFTEPSDSLYFLAKDDVSKHYPKTGFYPLHNNLDAMMARVFLIKNAKKSLNLQYFIFAEDDTAYAITQLLIEAADRGVKVKILIDDLLKKDEDVKLEALAQHQNIEIKLFNPTSARKLSGWLQLAFNIDTLGRRMHNKLLLADNSAAIIGGRNIENIYFAADKENIFIDNDILAVGPLAAEASNEFQTYWRSKISIDIKNMIKNETRADYELLRKELFKSAYSLRHNTYVNEAMQREFSKKVLQHELPLFYGEAHLYFDIPTKITLSENDTSSHLSEQIRPLFSKINKSLKIINPYFIPNDKIMNRIRELRSKGVAVSIVTNSLATNDGIPIYSAYSRSQRELLKLGVNLYELNPNSFDYIYKNQKYRKGSIPKSSLHAKSMVIDDEIVVIGSMNLDPRSIKLNTEMLSVIYSKGLAKIESRVFDNVIQLKNVFKLSLEKRSSQQCIATCVPQEDTKVVWTTLERGNIVKYYNDGNAGFWRRLLSNLSYYIPMDKYL
jgi:putative cardiolipin synthase